MKKMRTFLRLSNLINSILLALGGVLYLIGLPTNPQLVLMSFYVVLFGVNLCCFELHLRTIENIFYEYCGFMLRWKGRVLFLLFTGTLSLSLWTVTSIIAACYTGFNVFLNIYVMLNDNQPRMQSGADTSEMDERSRAETAARERDLHAHDFDAQGAAHNTNEVDEEAPSSGKKGKKDSVTISYAGHDVDVPTETVAKVGKAAIKSAYADV